MAEDRVETAADGSPKTNHGGRPVCFKTTFHEVMFVVIATMAIAMSSMLTGSVTVVSAEVGKSLAMKDAEITWLAAGPNLTSGSFLLFFGRVADLFGRKSMIIGSFALFTVFAIAAGFARTPLALDTLCGVMGFVGAVSIPPAQGMLALAYGKPSKRKNLAFACFSAGNPLGFVLSMIFSGIAAQIFNWRASFFLLAIIYALLTVACFFVTPNDDTPKAPLSWETFKRMDIVGSLLTVSGIALFTSALSIAGDAPQGWTTPYVLALLIVGAVLMGVFVIWELYYPYPLVPMDIWKDRDFSLVITILLLGFLAFPTTQFWLSLFMQRVWESSPLDVAVHLLPMAIAGILVNVFAGMVLHKISNKVLMGYGALSYVAAFLLYSFYKQGQSYWAFMFPGQVLAVIGADLEFNVANMYVMSSLAPSQQSVAGGIFQTVTKLAVAVGMGVSTAAYNAQQQHPSESGYYANNPFEPYAAAFWYCTACAALSLIFVPFLRIGTQGNAEKSLDASTVNDEFKRDNVATPGNQEDIEVTTPIDTEKPIIEKQDLASLNEKCL
ncbi:MFS general substrate transporter [Eremomyces bilateralis CBS 781.70]|uniref:MFS general substrate transporter n=1 Tax=Eremomyces bilateralis CBS 781.70 TaxID=1392243 RepID=A0A6G1FZ26_9PEZI|nr:MFS general substrate transporter [Eremomyces bilateralis CBS 781.70]KAF1811043.1 MFS general substrate transporter [Eremomyces bilateralis CBS 781.70]